MQPLQSTQDSIKKINQNPLIFFLMLIAIIAAFAVFFNFVTGGDFLERTNVTVIISHIVWPTFVAWGICFLFAAAIPTCPSAPLSTRPFTCIFELHGYPGHARGLIVGTLLHF